MTGERSDDRRQNRRGRRGVVDHIDEKPLGVPRRSHGLINLGLIGRPR